MSPRRHTDKGYEDMPRTTALNFVRAAADRACLRLSVDNRAGWQKYGLRLTVCKKSGPHSFIGCWFHRKTIDAAMIPKMTRACYCQGHWHLVRFYLGEDGQVYRKDAWQVYRAELEKRRLPEHITRVANRIELIGQ